MRLIFTLFSFLLLSFTGGAQKLTGIWRGYFSSSNGVYRDGSHEELYKYEIQIEQQTNNAISGVTYSYKSTVFYGKAQLQGILTMPSKSIIIKEVKLLDLKIGVKSEPCLMTCYLDYSHMGNLEVLEGTFISLNIKDKGDCGSGKVYLERVATSDFKKEDFLLKKKTAPPNDNPLAAKPKITLPPVQPKPYTKPPVTILPGRKEDQSIKKASPASPHRAIVPKSNLPKDDRSKIIPPGDRFQESANTKKVEKAPPASVETIQKAPTIPNVLVDRENRLVQTINTSEENIRIDLYDNGTIDNDTISVYHNNQLVVGNSRLSYTAITVKIKCSKSDSRHELVVVAENLGEIPPNTALMVVTAGRERYEIFLASNESRNAKVVINYIPK